MANTLTNLIPDAIAGTEIVSRELIGLIQRVTRSVSETRAVQDQTIRNPVAPKQTSAAVTPAATPPALSNITATNRTIVLDQFYSTRFHYTGEEEAGLKLSGAYPSLFAQNIAQSIRVLANQIETAIGALYYNASRAFGTAGTTPFASNLADMAALKAILNVNGTPLADRHLVVDSAGAYNLSKLTQLTNVNQAGTGGLLNFGQIPALLGFEVAESHAIPLHTVGTSTGQDCTAIEPVGETTIAYDGGDGGTILMGDTIAPAADVSDPAGAASKYLVNTAVTAASGNIVINSPGVRDATAINEELTLGATNYRANLAFGRDALVFAARPPKKPERGDLAMDNIVLSDPVSGLPFLLSVYGGYWANQYEVSTLYGVGLGNSEHMAILMG